MLRLSEVTEENRQDAAAIHLCEKHGFRDSGTVDEDVPDALNMICALTEMRP